MCAPSQNYRYITNPSQTRNPSFRIHYIHRDCPSLCLFLFIEMCLPSCSFLLYPPSPAWFPQSRLKSVPHTLKTWWTFHWGSFCESLTSYPELLGSFHSLATILHRCPAPKGRLKGQLHSSSPAKAKWCSSDMHSTRNMHIYACSQEKVRSYGYGSIVWTNCACTPWNQREPAHFWFELALQGAPEVLGRPVQTKARISYIQLETSNCVPARVDPIFPGHRSLLEQVF